LASSWQGLQIAGGAVDVVAERALSGSPPAAGGLALHAVDDPVDDRGALELGGHPEHLNHHPPRRGGGVERLGGRAEYHADLVQLVEDVGQAADGAGQPVHPVDQQHVEAVRAGAGQGLLQLLPVDGGAGGPLPVDLHQLPVVLAGEIRAQFVLLGLQGERLVLLIRGGADVDRDPDH
jgi:hypothetical protein